MLASVFAYLASFLPSIITDQPRPPQPSPPELHLPNEAVFQGAGRYLVVPGKNDTNVVEELSGSIHSFLFRVLHSMKDKEEYYWLVGIIKKLNINDMSP